MSILSDIPLNNFSVYWIRCKWHTNYFTQGYIGISSNIDRRFKEHKSKWASSSQHLKNAIDKYKEDIVFDILFSGLEEELALLIELELRSEPSIGWNIAIGGGLPPRMWGNKYRAGLTLSDEHLRALVLANTGRKVSQETIAKMSKAQKQRIRKPLTEEHKKNIGKWNLGKKMTPEAIEKTRQARLGTKMSQETKQKLSNSLSGRVLSEEHKKNISLGGKGRVVSRETRDKIAISNSIYIDVYNKDTMEIIAQNVSAPIWSRENGYSLHSITRVASGARKSHKGLIIIKVDKGEVC